VFVYAYQLDKLNFWQTVKNFHHQLTMYGTCTVLPIMT